LHVSRSVLPLVLLIGLVEVVGLATFAVGAQSDIAMTSVLASMFAPLAAVAAFVLFRERLAPRQVLGIALVVIGIATLGMLAWI
jgi:drug/metabolite transporter (DMT)-like permease